MTIPYTFGFPQLLILLVIVLSIGLIISSAMGLRKGHYEHFVDESGQQVRMRHRRKHIHPRRGISGVLLLVLALSLLWLATLTQTYLGLTNGIRVARVRSNPITNPNDQTNTPTMSVELILFDKEGKQVSDNFYAVLGNEWYVKGSIIKFPDWLNALGVHSGYKLTRLGGSFNDPDKERNSKHTVVVLNGGEDDFFKWANGNTWISPMVEATYGNAVFMQADGKTYDVLVSQTGLFAKPASGP